ncbi:SpoVG family protein [Planctomycetota bacterium]
MEVTEIRIKLVGDRDDKLRAFCTITFDHCFVVRDLKIIRGVKGAFVAMPSRKLSDLCPRCGGKNHLRARFCNECGNRLNPDRADRDESGRAKLHADIAHPINQDYRERLQRIILEAYEDELARADQPDYEPPLDDLASIEPDEPPEPVPHKPPTDNEDEPPHRFGEGLFL